jgi:hypothetical protein
MSALNPAYEAGFFLPDIPQSGIDLRISPCYFAGCVFLNVTSIG